MIRCGEGYKTNVHASNPELASGLGASCGDLFVCVLINNHRLGVRIGRTNTIAFDPYFRVVTQEGTGASSGVSIRV